MGRRIYDSNGEFVWKYTFGRQNSEMCRYAEQYGIGKYCTERAKSGRKGTKDYYEWDEHYWEFDKEDALKKLTALLKQLMKGKTVKEIEAIGMKAVHNFVKKQSAAWKKHYANDLKWVMKAKSSKDFQYYGSGGQGYNFEIYDIYAKGIEKHIDCTTDFLEMTKAFIAHIKKYDSTVFIDEY